MKRKPIEIIGTLLSGLNSLNKNEEYSINEIHQKTGFHYNTVKDYIKIITLIQCFSPQIKLNFDTNKFSINNFAPFTSTLNKLDQLILMLFINKAFNEEKAKSIEELKLSSSLYVPNKYIKLIKNERGYPNAAYLTTAGKFKAQGIIVQIKKAIGEGIDEQLELNSIYEKINDSPSTEILYHHFNAIDNTIAKNIDKNIDKKTKKKKYDDFNAIFYSNDLLQAESQKVA